jgi:endoglucanase
MVASYSQSRGHLLGDLFKLPADSAVNRQIVSFHYYDPYEFGIAGSRSAWGSDSDRERVVNDFAPLKTKFIDNNIPVVLGECGAVLQLYPSDSAKQEEARLSRRAYLPFIFATAKANGIVPVYWDNGSVTGTGEKFGLIKRSDGTANSAESDFLLKAMTGR